MLATLFWNEIGYAAQVDLLMAAAIFAVAIAVVVDLFLLVSKNIASWKKTAVFFAVSELAAVIVACWLGLSFGQIVGWCVFAILTVAVLFFTIYLAIIKWKLN